MCKGSAYEVVVEPLNESMN